jgi:hypothetical protein
MANAFEDGIYTIANLKNPELVIEAKDGKGELRCYA